MNEIKYSIGESWVIRANLLFLLNGLKKVLSNKKAIFISCGYWLFVFIMIKLKYFSILLGVVFIVIYILFLLLLGKPTGAYRMIRNFTRIGMVNKAGETPLLFDCSRSEDNYNMFILKFRNCGIPLSKWNDCKENIESGLNLNIENIMESGKQFIIIKAVSGNIVLPDYVLWDSSYLSPKNFEIVLGESITGQVKVNLTKIPHMLIGGSTGSGKSVLLKLLLMQCILKDAEVYIADFKGGVDFSAIWHDKAEIVIERDILINRLNYIVEELHRRKTILANSGCANIDEYNDTYGYTMRRIIFACDEVAQLLDKTGMNKEDKAEVAVIESNISTIARLGRAFGIHLILATQRPDANIISGQIKNNIDYRVCGRADDVLSQIILDNTDATDVINKDAQGRFLTNSGVVFQGFYFNEKDW